MPTTGMLRSVGAGAPAVLRRGRVADAHRVTEVVVQLEGGKRPADFVPPVAVLV